MLKILLTRLRQGNRTMRYPKDQRRNASATLAMPERFVALAFRNFFLQPMDGPAREANTAACIAYCLAHPQWRLSLQTHKVTGIP